jgi:hypothetical protein
MHCCDTGALPAVHLEHLDVKTAKRLNWLIGLLKRGARGNARILLILSGGHVDDMKVNDVSFDEAAFVKDEW